MPQTQYYDSRNAPTTWQEARSEMSAEEQAEQDAYFATHSDSPREDRDMSRVNGDAYERSMDERWG